MSRGVWTVLIDMHICICVVKSAIPFIDGFAAYICRLVAAKRNVFEADNLHFLSSTRMVSLQNGKGIYPNHFNRQNVRALGSPISGLLSNHYSLLHTPTHKKRPGEGDLENNEAGG